jgi:hypothetical protein
MRTAATVLNIMVTGEPRETETLMRGSEAGRQKSAQKGNSLAASPTLGERSRQRSPISGERSTGRRATGSSDGKAQRGTRDEKRRHCLRNRPRTWAYTTERIGLNDWKAVCSETGTYSVVGGQWNRAMSVPRQRPTQLGAPHISCTLAYAPGGFTAAPRRSHLNVNEKAANDDHCQLHHKRVLRYAQYREKGLPERFRAQSK